MRLFLLLYFLISSISRASSQCCTANPVAGSVNVGVLTKKTFRVISFYRYNYSDKYFEANRQADFNFIKKAYYNYASAIFSYGITDRITAETELGYYFNRVEIFNTEPEIMIKGWGFSNSVTSLKYAFTKKEAFEITGSLGFKFPFTLNPQQLNGVQLSQTVQPSTNAFGGVAQLFLQKNIPDKGLRLFLIHRTNINAANNEGYQSGTNFNTSFFISKSFNHRWIGIFQIRNEIRNRDIRDGNPINVSGGYLFFIAPQINFSITQTWYLSAMADLPVYQYYNGTQQASKYAVVFSVLKDFDFSSKKITTQ